MVASDLPEIRRVVREHELGLLVQPGNTASLVAALCALVEDTALRQWYSAQSRVAAQVLNWEQQEHLLLELYRRVMGEESRPRHDAEVGQ